MSEESLAFFGGHFLPPGWDVCLTRRVLAMTAEYFITCLGRLTTDLWVAERARSATQRRVRVRFC